jgi:HK97 family phage portal protein
MRLWPVTTKSSVEVIDDTDDALYAALAGPSPGAGVTVSTALQCPPVAAAVKLISEGVATLNINLVKEGEKEKQVDSHPALDLLRGQVNDWASGYEMIRDLVAESLLFDSGAFAWVNKPQDKPAEIINYKRGTIAVQYEETRQPVYRLSGKIVAADTIIHLRGPFERCPISLAREAIGAALAMEAFVGRFFQNGAQVGGVVESPKGLGERAWKAMRKGFRAAYETPKNAGKTLFLYDGATYKPLTMNSSDAQLLELRKYQTEEIARAFGMSSVMLGDLTKSSYANASQKFKEFVVTVLEPHLCAMEAALNRALLTDDERETMTFRFDRDDLSRGSLTERATAINSLIASEVINPNEGRSWLGMEAYEGGDSYANRNITVQPAKSDATSGGGTDGE